MTRRLAAATLLALIGAASACGPVSSRPRPNVLLISIDSLRADHLGCYGYDRPTSPAIDGLAAAGALFEVATSSSSWTLPAHAALFTGLPDSAHGVDVPSSRLASARRTLAEALRAAGYRTLGIWSGPLLDPRFGLDQGFDEYRSHSGDPVAEAVPDAASWERAVARSHQEITGPAILERVDELLAARGESPFFLFVHLWDVHYDYVPPAPFDGLFDADYTGVVDGRDLVDYVRRGSAGLSRRDLDHIVALYDGEIAWTDAQVSGILERLEDLGVANDTLVVVTADHGEEFFEHGSFGHKQELFEESIRIPLVMRYPGRIPVGHRIDAPVRLVDVAPTILELAGAEPLPDVLGQSLAPFFEGRSWTERSSLSELVSDPESGRSLLAVRSRDFKLIVERPAGKPIGLWDLEADPGEQVNLFRIDPSLTARATRELRFAVEELDGLAERHREGRSASTHTLEPELLEELESLGYIGTAPATAARLSASPNPIRACDGTGLGATTLRWELEGPARRLEVRVDAPDGKLFAQTGNGGSARTGPWVGDGMTFFLVEGDSGIPLARTVVRVTRAGCLPE